MLKRTIYKVIDWWEEKPAEFIFASCPAEAEKLAMLQFGFEIPCAKMPNFSWENEIFDWRY